MSRTVSEIAAEVAARTRLPEGQHPPSPEQIRAWAAEAQSVAATPADHAFVARLLRTAAGAEAIARGDWDAATELMTEPEA